MLLFAGSSEQERRAMYLQNIVNTYDAYKDNQMPFEWFGFVHWKTCIEYASYFPNSPSLESYLPEDIAQAATNYTKNEEDGQLFAVLQKKFGGK